MIPKGFFSFFNDLMYVNVVKPVNSKHHHFTIHQAVRTFHSSSHCEKSRDDWRDVCHWYSAESEHGVDLVDDVFCWSLQFVIFVQFHMSFQGCNANQNHDSFICLVLWCPKPCEFLGGSQAVTSWDGWRKVPSLLHGACLSFGDGIDVILPLLDDAWWIKWYIMVYQSLYISYHGIPWYSTSQQETSHDLSNLIYLFPPEMLNLSSLRGGCRRCLFKYGKRSLPCFTKTDTLWWFNSWLWKMTHL